MFRLAFQLSPKLRVIKPKLGSACLIPSADGRQIWFWGGGGKSAHSFVAVSFHTFYASLAFSHHIHWSNYPISNKWRTDSYRGEKKSNAFNICPGYFSPHQLPTNSVWAVSSCAGVSGHSRPEEIQVSAHKAHRLHVSPGNSCKPKGPVSVSRERPASGTQTARVTDRNHLEDTLRRD